MDINVILNNIRSVYNVGSVFRTADVAGISKIYLVGVTPIPLDRFGKFRADFLKVALGAEKTVTWEYSKNFAAVYKKLRKSASGRIEILAVEQDKRSIPYYTFERPSKSVVKKIALVFGEETKGLPKSILDKCDQILEIPMRGKKESLNVSVAAGIVIFALLYQC